MHDTDLVKMREKKAEYARTYRKKHADQYNLYRKNLFDNEKRRLHNEQKNQKIQCNCGRMISKQYLSGHRQTKMHQRLLASR